MTVIFSLDTSVSTQNSGIEHAIFDRIKALNSKKIKSFLVTTEWSPQSRSYIEKFIPKENYLNLFDFYQNVQFKDKDDEYIFNDDEFLKMNDYQLNEVKDDERGQFFDESINMYIRLMHGPEERILQVEHVAENGAVIQVETYDYRGFLSMTTFINQDGSRNQVWWTKDKRPVIMNTLRETIEGNAKTIKETSWTLFNHHGSEMMFDDFFDLKRYFLDDLNQEYEGKNIFVIDRGSEIQESVIGMQTRRTALYHIHNSHAGEIDNEAYSILNNHYRLALLKRRLFDGFIVATSQQKRDIEQRFPGINVYVIPVGTISNDKTEVKQISERKPNSMVITARHEQSKRIEQAVKVLALVRAAGIDATLDTYGYWDESNDGIARKMIYEEVKANHLESSYTSHGYTDNIQEVQENAQVYLLTSLMEGFNIAMMEAMSNGVVPVSYNVNYGPEELIDDGKTGYLVNDGDVKAMSEKIIKLFKDKGLLQKMSDNAIESSHRFYESKIADKWSKIIEDIDK